MNSGGLFKIYSERKTREAADYVVAIDAEFGAGHLQHSILPGTVSISFTKRKLFDILISFTKRYFNRLRIYKDDNLFFSFKITDSVMTSFPSN